MLKGSLALSQACQWFHWIQTSLCDTLVTCNWSKQVEKLYNIIICFRLQAWLSELCLASTDPALRVIWQPDPSFTLTVANLIVTDSLAADESKRYEALSLTCNDQANLSNIITANRFRPKEVKSGTES